MFADVFRQAVVGALHGKERGGPVFFDVGFAAGLVAAHFFHALFNFAHAGEVFVELGFVGGTDFALQARGFVFDAIENALQAAAAAIFEKAVEGE